MDHHERLTNIKYADGLMLSARSRPVLVEMIVSFSLLSTARWATSLNAAKSKIFMTKPLDHPVYVAGFSASWRVFDVKNESQSAKRISNLSNEIMA